MGSQSKPEQHQVKHPALVPIQVIEGREWWLWGFAVLVTLILTVGIIALTFPATGFLTYTEWFDLKEWARGLAALVLIFDVYTLYQHFQIQRIRRQIIERDHLFQLITENAADMIAVVDSDGRRLYNSPAYQKILGYSAEELNTSSLEQVHPDDRRRVMEAAEKAKATKRGERLEYRIRHKDGSWRILESTSSVVQSSGEDAARLVIVNRDITDRKRAEEMLAHNAFHDSLTNLPNRALFIDRLQHAMLLARRHSGYQFAILFIDIDEFKVLNDSLGHAHGDELLIEVGNRLTATLRELDSIARPIYSKLSSSDKTIARLGGDEFTVLLDDLRDPSDAIRVAERIQEKCAAPFTINGQEMVITISIGIALSSSSYTKAEDLLRDSEIAMYRAKRSGKARSELFDPAMHETAVKRLQMETDLRKGLEQNEFRVYYQPFVNLQTGKIAGFEALTRWQKSTGMVPPNEFISVADETGLILPMNRLLMQEATKQLHEWHAQFPSDPPLVMSVNITSKQFAQPELASEIGLILEQAELEPRFLQLEITETITMGDPKRAEEVFAELKALGVRLSIDDFGTGYSSLSRLQRFPVDSLKIDRAFISNMDSDPESREIVRIIIMLAHNLGMKVVAEGTETEEHIKHLQQLNCELAQGYYYSKPVDHATITQLLRSYTTPNVLAATAGK
jgi:diguanylate cyclase (GGDEF)-like protein/PAS domain S-box-containing protein